MDMNIRAVGDLQETKDGMAVANMAVLSFDVPTRHSTVYKRDSFVDSSSNSPITTIVTKPSGIQQAAISPEEFAERMKALDNEDYSEFDPSVDAHDIEERHMEADNIMTSLLDSLGYSEGCQIFNEMDKYYD